MNDQIERHGEMTASSNTDKVRKVIEDACKLAGVSVAIEQRTQARDKAVPAPLQQLHMTYTGERPMQYRDWFKLVDAIDVALECTGLIDWEFSELSDEQEQERMATWTIVADAG